MDLFTVTRVPGRKACSVAVLASRPHMCLDILYKRKNYIA